MNRDELVDKYLGISFKHMGRDTAGLDCWGLVVLAYRDIGIEVLDLSSYRPNWSLTGKNYFIEKHYDNWKEVTAPAFMDVLLFNNVDEVPFHAGLYLSNGQFIHGSRAGVVITRVFGKWRDRLQGIYRYDKD